MAFYFSKRKLRPKEEEEAGELNIVPYLDILMNLIIFMLLSMTGLATFGILNVNAPNYGGPSAGAGDNQDKPLLLTVAIGKDGFYVAATGGVLPGQTEPSAAAPGQGAPTVPKRGADYDFGGLTEKMKAIKTEFPNETKVIIAGESDTTYEVLVGTMDATRETADRKLLFPDVTLGAF
jgi:biopolymer transport protein TolR